jgi:hypothetical protein
MAAGILFCWADGICPAERPVTEDVMLMLVNVLLLQVLSVMPAALPAMLNAASVHIGGCISEISGVLVDTMLVM